PNDSLSIFFNSIIFIRALEGNGKRYGEIENRNIRVLLETWKENQDSQNFVIDIFKSTLKILGDINIPKYLIDFDELGVFNELSKQTLSYLLNDFYVNRHNSFYNYDFSIMSKHALSRIYERYVSILKIDYTPQLSMFPSVPTEEVNKAYGAIYTPQYIARFFAKYLKENLSPIEFKKIKAAEPAVGSGIFLRSLLELKCDPRQDGVDNQSIEQAFQDIIGLDVDANACKAAELSLSLLQLVLTKKFPEKLNIINAETIEYIMEHDELKGSYDAVLSNPPFIATTGQTEEMRKRIAKYLGDGQKGRTDSFIAFVKVGLELLKPGGYGLYVLPHSFLMSKSAGLIREELSKTCWIKCVADLSAIPVFENTGIYVILLIFQKKSDSFSLP